MAIRDYIITIIARPYDVENNNYPKMSILFDDELIQSNLEIKYTERSHKTLLPAWMKITAGQDVKGLFIYKFIVTLDDCEDSNTKEKHTIKFILDNKKSADCINIDAVLINQCNLVDEGFLGSINKDNTDLELCFYMPLFPHEDIITILPKSDHSIEYMYLYPIIASSRYFDNHVCKNISIKVIDDYYNKKDPSLYFQSEKLFLSHNKEFKELWISFQNAFDDHCVKFNLPKVLISSSWFICYHDNGSDGIASHVHKNSVLVGTYYPYVDTECSAITFEHPSLETIRNNTISRIGYKDAIKKDKNTPEYQIKQYNIIPQTGMFNIFPGYASHHVKPTKSKNKVRYIIVANTVLYSEKDRFGLKDLRYENL